MVVYRVIEVELPAAGVAAGGIRRAAENFGAFFRVFTKCKVTLHTDAHNYTMMSTVGLDEQLRIEFEM